MIKSINKLKKNIIYNYSQNVEQFLNKWRLQVDVEEPIQKYKQEQNKEQKDNDYKNLIDQYLEPIDTEKMDAVDVIMSPIMIERKKKIQRRNQEILNQNFLLLKKIEYEYYQNSSVDRDKLRINLNQAFDAQDRQMHSIFQFYNSSVENEQEEEIKDLFLKFYQIHPDTAFYDNTIYLKYPGSIRGARPQDDPKKFQKFLKQNISDSKYTLYKHIEEYIYAQNEGYGYDDIRGEFDPTDFISEGKTFRERKSQVLRSLNKIQNFVEDKRKDKMTIMVDSNQDDVSGEVTNVLFDYIPQEFQSQIPAIPEEMGTEEDLVLKQFTKWADMKFVSDFQQFIEYKDKINDFLNSNPETNVEELVKKPYPTLMAYYNLLPEEARKAPSVISMTCMLEKRFPLMPLKEKQILLNFAAQLILKSREEEDIFAEALMKSDRKFYANILDYVHIEYPLDDGTSINSPKRQLLENITPKDELSRPYYIDDINYIEDITPCNPIDYYDNDDGFWDEWIEKKLEKYEQVPIYPDRPFFKHQLKIFQIYYIKLKKFINILIIYYFYLNYSSSKDLLDSLQSTQVFSILIPSKQNCTLVMYFYFILYSKSFNNYFKSFFSENIQFLYTAIKYISYCSSSRSKFCLSEFFILSMYFYGLVYFSSFAKSLVDGQNASSCSQKFSASKLLFIRNYSVTTFKYQVIFYFNKSQYCSNEFSQGYTFISSLQYIFSSIL